MLKLIIFVTLSICFVCSQNIETHLPPSKVQTSIKLDDESKNSSHNIKKDKVNDLKSLEPCIQSKNHDDDEEYSNDDPEHLEYLLLTANNEKNKTDDVHNSYEIISKNANNESKNDTEIPNICDCDDCASEPDSKDSIYDPVLDLVLRDRNGDPDSAEHLKPCKKVLNKKTKQNATEIVSKGRRILPGVIKNASQEELLDSKLYQGRTQSIPYEAIEKATRRKDLNYLSINSNDQQLQMDRPYDNEQSVTVDNTIESALDDPTQGQGVYDVKDTSVMLMENSRICYACSTISDPTCWAPNRKTTVKYCQKGHDSCLTKSFRYRGTTVIIRDCGSYCVTSAGEKNYRSCSICHSDFCNSASSLSISTGFAIIIFFGIMFNTR